MLARPPRFSPRHTGRPCAFSQALVNTGMGCTRSSWGLVQPRIAERVRAVVYDRAGLGRSHLDPAPRTLHRLAADFGALLDALGHGPFILVGHSWGGPIVRVAAAVNRSRIRGRAPSQSPLRRCVPLP